MNRSIIIIGAGMGGLAAGIYGRLNGYDTRVFEMHSAPGGQCCAWKRKGYTFDGCIHHLFGCSPWSKINGLWQELGAMPRAFAYPKDCVSAAAPDGTRFNDLYDLKALEQQLTSLAPADGKVIKEYLKAIKLAAKTDLWGALMLGSAFDKAAALARALPLMPYFRPTMRQFGERFSHPFLKQAFPLLMYSLPEAPLIMHLARHAYGLHRDIAWPVGGAHAFAESIARRYQALGGDIQYGKKVDRILTENGKAAGVKLDDGTEHRADIVISNADGRKTILKMLEARFIDERVRSLCAEPQDETNWAVHVFLGVNRDLSKEPSALVQLLDKPVTIAGRETRSLEMQLYGHDATMAPAGKGVIKVELVSKYSYWKALHADRARYTEEKQQVAETVIGLLEPHFPGLKRQVEAVDVPTLMTWERFMGGTHGFLNAPSKKPDFMASLLGKGQEMTLPGLENFYFAGSWMTSAGALFANALSGKTVIKAICRNDGKKFKTR